MSTDDAVLRSDALLEAIYESAVEPSTWLSLHQHLLKNFRRDDQFNDQQKTFLDFVLGHVQRALEIAETRERLQWERQQVSNFIDSVAPAVCVIRADRSIVGLNPAAQRILQAQVDAPLAGSLLAPWQRETLERTLDTALRDGYGSTTLVARLGADEILLHVARLSTEPVALFAVVLFEQDAALRRALDQYAELFRLTEKERRVVEQAIRCRRLDRVAEAESIGYHTARQHLKAVYAKTGAENQAELVAGVLRQSVLQEAARTQNAALLPHVRGLVHSRFLNVGSRAHPRQLCYAEYGDPAGTPLLYFHSLLGSRLELLVHDDLLRAHRVRLVAVDRPGFGHSDFYEYASYQEYTRDVRKLLDALVLDEVGVLSCSAGTPHALACAVHLSERVSEVHCTGSMVPVEHMSASLSQPLLQKIHAGLFRIAPALLRPAVELMLRGQTVESVYRMMLNENGLFRSNALDAQFISRPEHIDYFVAFTIESLRQGPRAWGKEALLLNDDWGIPFRRARCPVHFWHGALDELVPVDMVRSFAGEFTEARVDVLDAETHLLIFRHLAPIVQAFRRVAEGAPARS